MEIEIKITQEIIDKSNQCDIFNCVACNALRTIPEFKDQDIQWGAKHGYVGNTRIETDINTLEINEPQSVIFRKSFGSKGI